jgi:hypothetical protein
MAISSFTRVKFDQALETLKKRKTRQPELGDHLVTARTAYTHHGIYVGKGQVIHYSGFHDGWRPAPVIKTSLADFASGNHVMVARHSKRKYEASESIERAYRRLGENAYCLVSNNCEHFVNWCIQGRASSKQIEELRALLIWGIAGESKLRLVGGAGHILRGGANVNSLPVPSGSLKLGIVCVGLLRYWLTSQSTRR